MIMKNDIGALGEGAAVQFLKRKGYTIVARNFRTKIGELDIICRKGDTIIFVEVKALQMYGADTPDNDFLPEMHFTPSKFHKMQRTALLYCKQNRINPECSMRFDLIAIDADENGNAKDIRHYENLGE